MTDFHCECGRELRARASRVALTIPAHNTPGGEPCPAGDTKVRAEAA